MKTNVLLLALISGTASHAPAQGALTAPGPPASTMKTLEQIEPRQPLGGGTNGVLIDRPGSYYLTGNLSTTGTAIRITADNVTLDLNGHALMGASTNGNADFGIRVDGDAGAARKNVTVKHGSIKGYFYSLYFDHTVGCRAEQLIAADSRHAGFVLSGSGGGPCHGNQFLRCQISKAGNTGMWLFGDGGECNANQFEACQVTGTGSEGIVLSASSGQCNGNVFRECSVFASVFSPFYLVASDGHCDGNIMLRCTMAKVTINSSGVSFYAGSNGTCSANIVRECSIYDVGGAGVTMSGFYGQVNDNTVLDCAITSVGRSGVQMQSGVNTDVDGNLVRGNTIRAATDQGVWIVAGEGNRIEANHISGTTGTNITYGIRTSSSDKNLILKNFCVGHDVNYSIDATDTYGPIVTAAGALATTGVGFHPWANYSR